MDTPSWHGTYLRTVTLPLKVKLQAGMKYLDDINTFVDYVFL
jgi:hypothetical protein